MNSTPQNKNARRQPGAATKAQQPRNSNESQLENLLSRLDGVRRTGPGRWIAKCPAHKDRAPSLSITTVSKAGDGRVLVRCFAECPIESVLDSIGLTFKDILPRKRAGHYIARERRPFDPLDVLRCLSREALILIGASAKLLAGESLTQADFDRLQVCAQRILNAEEKTHV